MGRLGTPCSLENILITNGSQQGLDFLGKLFLDPGDGVFVTKPTYLGALQAWESAPAIAELKSLGVEHAVLITGDNSLTAQKTGRESGRVEWPAYYCTGGRQ